VSLQWVRIAEGHGTRNTGVQKYRYIRTGVGHFSLAFTYDCIASAQEREMANAFFII
jgi:hypothetical protein